MRLRWDVQSSILATLIAGVALVGSITAPARLNAATATVSPDGATIDPDKPLYPRTVLGEEPIRADAPQDSGPNVAVPIVKPQGMDYPRVLGALGIVIGLIFVLRWGGRFLFPGAAGRGASRAIEVLSRSPLSPKQQVLLIRVGRRLVVVGDTGSQMNALCEITDPDEIASLVGQLRDEKSSATPRAFGALFGTSRGMFEAATDVAPPEEQRSSLRDAEDEAAPAASAREELNGLRDRVRMLAEQFKEG